MRVTNPLFYRRLLWVLRIPLTVLFLIVILSGCGGGGGGGGSSTPPVGITLFPSTILLTPSGSQNFTAAVANARDTSVSWHIVEGSSGGSVTDNGVYTAPVNAGTYHVVAASHQDSTKTATATVTVVVQVSVTPASPTLNVGDTQTFAASVQGTSNQAVNWSVQEGLGGGVITPSGVYVAPNAPGTYHIVAASQEDSSRMAFATVTVQAGGISGTIQ